VKTPAVAVVHVSLRWRPGQSTSVGRLAWRDRRAFFEYSAEALAAPQLAISPFELALRPGVHEGPIAMGGLHGVFSDGLPDAWGRMLVDRRARRSGLDPVALTPVDRLAIVGSRGIGALCYEPEFALATSDGSATLDELASDGARLLAGAGGDVLDQLWAAGGSPGGARPKVLVGWREADDHIVHGTVDPPPDHRLYMVKFRAPSDPEDIGPIELAYHRMAAAAGLRTTASRVLRSATGPGYFATERFDRPDPATGARLHAHTLAGLLHADHRLPALDYDALLRVALRLCRDQREADMAFRYMAFNVLACNRDDHGKQFTFLMDVAGRWRLAPAYDLTFSEGPGGEHSTAVGGNGRDPSRDDMLRLGRSVGIAEADAIIDEVASVVSRWRQFAAEAGVGRASTAMIARQLARIGRPG